jgi:hypothetical protein
MIKHFIYLSIIICLSFYCGYLSRNQNSTNEYLNETSYEYGSDILYRIDMLQNHITFKTKPSPEWINDVLGAAKYEITNYRMKN